MLGAESIESQGSRAAKKPVLAVDLDGTLVKTDLLLESLLALLRHFPQRALESARWLCRGRAYFKSEVARWGKLDVAALPYRQDLLDYLRTERAQGRNIVLATAANADLAAAVAEHLKIFDEVLASSATLNLQGKAKRDLLIRKFGERGFDYVGNSAQDRFVWASADHAIKVEDRRASLLDWIKALRPRHWIKNLLVFAALIAAHRINDAALLGKTILTFLAFCCVASGGYLLNDLLDLPSDRHHPSKRLRAFAAGDLPIAVALWLIPVLLGLGCVIASLVSGLVAGAVLAYLALNLTYSLWAKKFVVLDVILLAGLYTLRMLAGAAAVRIWPSEWMLAFSTFLFFSMALVKRYGELALMKRIDGKRARARGYELTDAELLAMMGIASGYLSVMVLALYINAETAQDLYRRYDLLWFLCPLLFYWISDIWLIAHRGRMPDDPVAFAVHDRTSRVLISLMVLVGLLAL